MAGFFSLDTLSLNTPEEPDYIEPPMEGMTPEALFDRYLHLQDACVDAEMELSFEGGDDTVLDGLIAKMKAVATLAFLPIPYLPFFPWKAPVL